MKLDLNFRVEILDFVYELTPPFEKSVKVYRVSEGLG